MSIADDAKTILLLEAFADEAKRLAGERRTRLAERARKQLAEDGIAPSWHLPAVAKVTLAVTKTALHVADERKLTEWVIARFPDETERTVKARFITALLGRLKVEGDVAVDPATGEIVPGIGVRQGGQPANLSVKAEPGVKDDLAGLVAQMLAAAHPEIAAPAETALPAPEDPWLPSGDPFAAFPARGAS